ncbi:leucyl aminopeptidase [Ureaplasma ceti]|uniref:Probable cytosol aminopeptidase n=1 Tax=Ureaplasma ceti TaxID=3119530 RepID=A0ABP9U5P4_9BACT
MKISNQFESKRVLKAVEANHGIADFEDIKGTHQIFHHEVNSYNIVMGKELEADELFRALSTFIEAETRVSYDIDVDSFLNIVRKEDHETLINILVNAVEYGSMIPWTLNKKLGAERPEHTLVITDHCMTKLAQERHQVAKDRNFARSLQDMPSNLMVPGKFVELMKEHFAGLNVKITVLERKELEEKGMNLLVGVGQAATKEADQPRLMVIEYLGNPENKEELIGFVGKGVCFDTGGNNIKISGHMRWMKYDMSGAAIVGSTLHALATNNVKVNAVAVMPLVLNLCDTNAQRPDDVIVSYNGMSVEIDNTDAEGRLILADALTYAVRDLKVTEVYDIATLTGAMVFSLGNTYSGIWASTNDVWHRIEAQAEKAGELVWRLPFHHDFKDLLSSRYADIANSVADMRGGSSRAAAFLREFTEGKPYGHFDVAATADKDFRNQHKGTGAIVNTFYNIAKNR